MEEYKAILRAFCYYTAQLSRIFEELTFGVCPERQTLELLERVEVAETLLLESKENLGLKGGISFLEDFSFDTGNPLEKRNAEPVFGIKDGLFFGDREKTCEVILKWMEQSDEEIMNNPYKYEKAIYLLSLVFEGNDDLVKEERGAA